jgi:hypothetical protein
LLFKIYPGTLIMKFIICIVCCALSIAGFAQQSQPPAKSVWMEDRYYELVAFAGTWEQCRRDAEKRGGRLACIKNDSINSAIYSRLLKEDSSSTVYIGAQKTDGKWGWIDGAAIEYSKWDHGQPNSSRKNLACGVFWSGKDTWNDVSSRRLYPNSGYILELTSEQYSAISQNKVNPAATATKIPSAPDNPITLIKSGNFMYTPFDLENFENQLDYIEKTFWIAASLPRTDSFSKDFEKKLLETVCLSRNIQASLVVKNKSNEGTDLPCSTLKLTNVWHKFAGKGPYYYDKLRCLSRRSYGSYNNNDTSAYIQWLNDTTIANVSNFQNGDECSIAAKVSDYYMAIKDLRCNIVSVAKQNIFNKNTQLSVSDKTSIIRENKPHNVKPSGAVQCRSATSQRL